MSSEEPRLSREDLPIEVRPPGRWLGLALILFGVGVAVTLAGLGGSGAERVWRALHFNWLYWLSLAQGGVVFAAVLKITKSRWARGVSRLAEGAVAFLPVALLLFGVLLLGREAIYPWLHEELPPEKALWLTPRWVFVRDAGALLVLLLLSVAFVRSGLRADLGLIGRQPRAWKGEAEELARAEKRRGTLAPILILCYAFLFSLLAYDQVQALSPHWPSTLFGAYFFWGGLLTGTATTAVLAVSMRQRLGLERTIGSPQLHDLGKLVFAFCIFWGYLFFSQYLVIWYGNLPEETEFVFVRFNPPYQPWAWAVLAMVFLAPFWGLLGVKPKKTPVLLGGFSLIILVGLWLERFLLVVPSHTHGHELGLGLPEVGIGLGFLGLFLISYLTFARRFPLVAIREYPSRSGS